MLRRPVRAPTSVNGTHEPNEMENRKRELAEKEFQGHYITLSVHSTAASFGNCLV